MPPSVPEPFCCLPSLPSEATSSLEEALTGAPSESYKNAVAALSVMGVGCLTGVSPRPPTKHGNSNPLGVRPAIAKPRAPCTAVVGSNGNNKQMNVVGAAGGAGRRARSTLPLSTATSLYLDGATVTMGWLCSASLPPPPDYGGADAPSARDVCEMSCAKRLGAVGCGGLDPTDIEGSMRLRLALIEEAFEKATARRFITSVERAVASGSLGVFAIHRPLWSRPACLACTAINAPRRPPPIAIVPMIARDDVNNNNNGRGATNDEHQEPSMPSPASSTASSPDCAPPTLATAPRSSRTVQEPWSATVGITGRPHIAGVCVYVCGRTTDGEVAWTVRRRSHPAGARVASQSPPTHTNASCARCAEGMHAPGALPSVSSSNVEAVAVDVAEVIGAVAANLIEGIAGAALSMDLKHQCHRVWSGVPGQPLTAPSMDVAASVAVPTTTWLATETKVVVRDTSRKRPETGCDALYTCARLSYATARLADVAARQRAAHDYAGGIAQGDPRRVCAAVPVSYAPSIDSPAAALAWVRGAASAVGPTIDADRTLNRLIVDYRTHVLARDLERFPLDPLDPSRLPDEVRALARRLQALVRSPAEPPDLPL
ncbi:BCSC C incomplete domain containing protein [Pandoravirus macleodensis]|uniref:BCSC C incomplete domain containing protein n=1 Tax=Pandoravirus macleodensis TaxID=2107707 RepID=A0A2U7UGC3_9VIRU|nr:BCSC C incomplete domain containing protein [Pandoravirus macleodensis]AVK77569.1 BCSC C incomplete domain containing protein [Pandoravirus macleodensis]